MELARLADLPTDVLTEGKRIAEQLTSIQTRHEESSEGHKISIRRKALLRVLTYALTSISRCYSSFLAAPHATHSSIWAFCATWPRLASLHWTLPGWHSESLFSRLNTASNVAFVCKIASTCPPDHRRLYKGTFHEENICKCSMNANPWLLGVLDFWSVPSSWRDLVILWGLWKHISWGIYMTENFRQKFSAFEPPYAKILIEISVVIFHIRTCLYCWVSIINERTINFSAQTSGAISLVAFNFCRRNLRMGYGKGDFLGWSCHYILAFLFRKGPYLTTLSKNTYLLLPSFTDPLVARWFLFYGEVKRSETHSADKGRDLFINVKFKRVCTLTSPYIAHGTHATEYGRLPPHEVFWE